VDIPSSLRAVDADWLVAALLDAGHECPAIRSLSYEPMPGVIGAMGEIGIFSLVYDEPCGLPSRLVGKCPLDHEAARQFNAIMQYYSREAGFYRDLAPEVPMQVPRCWANVSADGRNLLLIDFVDGRAGDILEGSSFETMWRLVGDLAVLHGRYWLDERLTALPWMLDWRTPSFLAGVPLVRQSWAAIREGQPDAIPTDLARVCEATWLSDTETWLNAFAARPWTFVHGDYELDNLIFPEGDVIVVDWQGCLRSFPGFDLGWLLATSGSSETVAREDELLDHYRLTLADSGGPAWSRDDVVCDLAWAMMYYVPGMTLPLLQDYSQMGPQGQRLERRFRAFFTGCVAAALRWDTAGQLASRV
jgi:hypothetical protein